jgi:tRNA pseudouridine32 synthase/23S rRNA pseudouridine746 synthase/23S rRNA pseudouridine1911/1915/1917 synthase
LKSWAEIRDECVLLEDEAILVLNKPAGISVMGERHETDLVTLAEEAGETLMPVHRIDKVTSGVVLFAKEVRFHGDLTRQFNKRTVDKAYLAITRPGGPPDQGTIELPLSIGRKSRVRVAANRGSIMHDSARNRWTVAQSEVFTHVRTYPSTTRFLRAWEDEHHAVLAVQPTTGRRHQIRVHLAWIGHPIEGDPLFDKQSAARGDRTCLHSRYLAFDAAWAGGTRISVEAPPPMDFWAPVLARLPDDSPTRVLRNTDRAIAQMNTQLDR